MVVLVDFKCSSNALLSSLLLHRNDNLLTHDGSVPPILTSDSLSLTPASGVRHCGEAISYKNLVIFIIFKPRPV